MSVNYIYSADISSTYSYVNLKNGVQLDKLRDIMPRKVWKCPTNETLDSEENE